ncbi:MAG: hypothetical protein GY697_21065 [Desulfobacterales bacterium]|nr:hypothetical protein [Desulfobacterales bacterium]
MHPKSGHIDQDEIETIKKGVDLVPFMQACGIKLKQVGSNYRGHCPFHEDTTPSLTVNPKENRWNCFGCDKGGDCSHQKRSHRKSKKTPGPGRGPLPTQSWRKPERY